MDQASLFRLDHPALFLFLSGWQWKTENPTYGVILTLW